MAIRFGDFALDLERRELRDRSSAIHLTPKAFQLLQVLVRVAAESDQSGQAV